MTVTGYSYITLLCLDKFNGERSVSAVYHLLRGKKTSQTLQDMNLFGVSCFFSLFPHVSRETIDTASRYLEEHQWIRRDCTLTERGKAVLKDAALRMPVPAGLNGWKYGSEARSAWSRLSLLVQTVTHLVTSSSRFMPVTSDEDTQQWVKGMLSKIRMSKQDLSRQLYRELDQFLSAYGDSGAELFVYRLTSPERAGLTYVQLGEKRGMDPVYTELCFWSIVHSLLNELEPSRYPLLSGLSVRESGSLPLTLTAEKTRRLLKQGLDKETAGRVRNLKGSTIEDHIVEIATHDPEFDFKPYISEQGQAEIAHAIKEIDSRQLKKIKEHFGSKYSYFQIRLCMASAKE